MEYEYIKIPKAEDRIYDDNDIGYSILKPLLGKYNSKALNKKDKFDMKTAQILVGLIYRNYISDSSTVESRAGVNSGNGAVRRGIDLYNLVQRIIEVDDPVSMICGPSPIQRIYYGAPGTGKSHKAKEVTSSKKVFRTTFHPDTDYASFVGCYKPCVNNQSVVRDSNGNVVAGEYDKKIEYSYIPQIFVKAYCEAWKSYIDYCKSTATSTASSPAETEELNSDQTTAPQEAEKLDCENVCLLIEELNRGNCAQIFGDLFQLLDRTQNGFSEYSILADCDLCKYIKEESGIDFETYYNIIKDNSDITDEGLPLIPNWDPANPDNNEVRLCLPPNLSIICTMNTSDQSLFPMDSAFKRRWEWEYVPIDYTLEKSNFIICIDATHKYRWLDFLKVINCIIYDKTKSEDKQMGNFFVKGNSQKEVSSEQFVSKVMFYLWNEICKDNPSAKKSIFVSKQDKADGNFEDKAFTFNELFEGGKEETLIGFMYHLEVQNIASDEDPSTSETDKKTYKEHLTEFCRYCNNHASDVDVQRFIQAFKLPNPHWNELWISQIESLSGCSIKIGVNKTGAYINWYISNFAEALEKREEISTEFGITKDELSGYSSSGWKRENKYFKIQFEKAEKTDEEEFRWIIETAVHLFDYFRK